MSIPINKTYLSMFFTYILQSEKDSSLYIGQTNNLTDRLLRHNQGRNQYTKTKTPWILIYSKEFETRSQAVQLEMKLKAWKNKDRVLAWVGAQPN
jgi:putative endonuclease